MIINSPLSRLTNTAQVLTKIRSVDLPKVLSDDESDLASEKWLWNKTKWTH